MAKVNAEATKITADEALDTLDLHQESNESHPNNSDQNAVHT